MGFLNFSIELEAEVEAGMGQTGKHGAIRTVAF